jgi:hypothetical protein
MSKEEIQEIREELEIINKKVDSLVTSQNKHLVDQQIRDTKMDAFIEDIKPILEAKTVLVSFNKFLKWIGLPAIGSVVAYYLFRKV